MGQVHPGFQNISLRQIKKEKKRQKQTKGSVHVYSQKILALFCFYGSARVLFPT